VNYFLIIQSNQKEIHPSKNKNKKGAIKMAKFNKFAGAFVAVALTASLLPAASVSAAKADAAKVSGTDQIIVKMKPGKTDKSAEVAAKHGASVQKSLKHGGYKVLKVQPGKAQEVLAKLKADPEVEMAELDEVLTIQATPNDPSYGSQYHLPRIQANLAWDYFKGSSSTVIAIVDTGVDIQHPDLDGKIVAGYDFVNNDSNADDDHGHGTHCAGIATAETNNSTNGAGVDWNAKIMPVKVLSASGSGYTSDIIDGVYFAADNGAKVISMSLGGGSYSTAFQDAINYAFNTKNAVVVAAAGNNGNTAVQYPAGYNNVLSVAATDANDAKAYFSTYGTWVDVAAPGYNIYSTKNGGGMTYMSGTSMATPVVAGVAGLVWNRLGLGASAASVVNKITSTADVISGTGSYWIYGRVNAYRAVTQ
jgi:thermitase